MRFLSANPFNNGFEILEIPRILFVFQTDTGSHVSILSPETETSSNSPPDNNQQIKIEVKPKIGKFFGLKVRLFYNSAIGNYGTIGSCRRVEVFD